MQIYGAIFAMRLYWNHTSAWMISSKFAAFLQNTISEEHLWRAASGHLYYNTKHTVSRFLSLSAVIIHQFHFYTKILTLIPFIPTSHFLAFPPWFSSFPPWFPAFHHSFPDSPHSPHSYPDSPHSLHSHPDYPHSHHSPLSVSWFPIPAFTESGKIVFYSVKYKNGCLAASYLFHMFTQSIKFYTFHYHVLKSTHVCEVWFMK